MKIIITSTINPRIMHISFLHLFNAAHGSDETDGFTENYNFFSESTRMRAKLEVPLKCSEYRGEVSHFENEANTSLKTVRIPRKGSDLPDPRGNTRGLTIHTIPSLGTGTKFL